MMRVIVTPAVLPPEALAELKDWLGITTTIDDASLGRLLAVAVDVCADFTGLMPLACGCEEMLPSIGDGVPPAGDWQRQAYPGDWRQAALEPGWQELVTRPVSAVSMVASVALDGTRTVLASGDYGIALSAGGACALSLPGAAYRRFVVGFTAGLAADWTTLADPLRHGIMRLAAHQYRNREGPGAEPLPPASVAALWRPWRRVRLT